MWTNNTYNSLPKRAVDPVESMVPPGEDTGHYHEYSAHYIANTCQYITRYTCSHSGDQSFCRDWTNIVNYWHSTISHLWVCQDWTNVGSYWHTCMPVYANMISVLAHKVHVYWVIISEIYFWLFIILKFSDRIIFSEDLLLLDKKGFTVFQKFELFFSHFVFKYFFHGWLSQLNTVIFFYNLFLYCCFYFSRISYTYVFFSKFFSKTVIHERIEVDQA